MINLTPANNIPVLVVNTGATNTGLKRYFWQDGFEEAILPGSGETLLLDQIQPWTPPKIKEGLFKLELANMYALLRNHSSAIHKIGEETVNSHNDSSGTVYPGKTLNMAG